MHRQIEEQNNKNYFAKTTTVMLLLTRNIFTPYCFYHSHWTHLSTLVIGQENNIKKLGNSYNLLIWWNLSEIIWELQKDLFLSIWNAYSQTSKKKKKERKKEKRKKKHELHEVISMYEKQPRKCTANNSSFELLIQ